MGNLSNQIFCDNSIDHLQTPTIRKGNSPQPSDKLFKIIKSMLVPIEHFQVNFELLDDMKKILSFREILRLSQIKQILNESSIIWLIETNNNQLFSIIYEKSVSKFVGNINEELKKLNGIEIPKLYKKDPNLSKKCFLYHGSFKNNQYNGEGKQFLSNNSYYEGQFENGTKEGNGRIILENGDEYIGEFRNDLPNGRGKYLIKSNGCIYEGLVENGVIRGDGVLIFDNGSRYEGEFFNGSMQGVGLIRFINSKLADVTMVRNRIKNLEFRS